MGKLIFVIIIVGSFFIPANAQPEKTRDAAELKLALDKLNVLGTVLYVAAHPDDENTALLSYYSSGKLVETGYLALTRGDGGQNLIGSEQAEQLGVIRTQELLAARKIDGAEQFFSRAIDFGYSKSAEETFEIWGKEQILSDVVWVIRKFRPDVIITRFPGTGYGGHGHHSASALLAEEAFNIAGNPEVFPEQIGKKIKLFNSVYTIKPWQPKRIYWNAWNPDLAKNDTRTEVIHIDLGEYNALLGRSYTEIAARARSMHKSQGFGASARRGETLNYFTFTAGTPAEKDLFEDIDISWDRVPGGEKTGKLISEAISDYNFENPSSIIPVLLEAYNEMEKLDDNYWIPKKKKELLEVIRSAAGLWMEAIASDYSVVPGEELKITSGIVNRSDYPFILKDVKINFRKNKNEINSNLVKGNFLEYESTLNIPDEFPYSQPFWLREKSDLGTYKIDSLKLIGKPDNDPPLSAEFILNSGNTELIYKVPVLYHWTDPVKGEQYRPIEITPPVTINFENSVYLFPGNERKINLVIRSHKDNVEGNLGLVLPEEWKAEPKQFKFNFKNKNDEVNFTFTITPPETESEVQVTAKTEIEGNIYSKSIETINYDHFPVQTIFPEAEAKLVKLNINKVVNNIGYIMGSGDNIPFYLEQLGYKVDLLSDNEINNADFSKYDAIVTGIRAYNTRDRLVVEQSKLLDYVKGGGTLIVQYNVNRNLSVSNLGPYPFEISRDRITNENASINLLKPKHQLLNYPNEIDSIDFKGWVQERGLYFADKWDPQYETVIAGNDPGEDPKEGGILFTKYGDGVFIYTGYSWFRQLPAGVPGAFKLFVNLITSGKKLDTKQQSAK